MKKLVGVTNVKTGKWTPAPAFCPACSREYAEAEVRNVMGTTFECLCECGHTCVILQDDGVKQQ